MLNKIRSAIERSVAEANENEDRPIWKKPLVAAVRADHPDFATLKTAVAPTHLLPEDVLTGAKSVVCFFIPFADFVAESNREPGSASAEWAHAYVSTNALIAAISDRVEALLETEGFSAGKIPATHNFDEVTLMSDWSHRHIAHIAGLGEFGINNMLITAAGSCGRLGSIVTDCELDTVPIPPPHRERCLFKLNGSCGACIRRCETGAYERKANGSIAFNRARCYAVCLANAETHKPLGYADVCGKCLVGLPCSTRSPA